MGFKGSIGTDQRCPKCGKKFQHVVGTGFLCLKDLTAPNRFWISAQSLGIPRKQYSDRLGNVFDSYQAVYNQWSRMNTAYLEAQQPNGKPWIAEDWIPGKVREQQFDRKALAFIETKRPLFERKKLSKSHWQQINNIIRNRLIPFFGQADIRYISDDDVKRLYLHLLDLRREDDSTAYSDSYIKECMAMLKSIFLEYRPADVPKFPAHTVAPKKEKQWLGLERQIAIEPHIPARFRLPIRALISTGMRVGELRALQVNDMADGVLRVWKAWTDQGLRLLRKAGGEVAYPVPLDLWRDLQDHAAGKGADDLIFTAQGGGPLCENTLYKVWKRACTKAKVKYIPLQQASRHSMASQIMAAHKQKAIEEIQAKLGHSDKHTQKAYVVE